MKNLDDPLSFYNEVVRFIDLDNHDAALKLIENNIISLKNPDNIALAYLNCGFLNNKLGDNISAIKNFSKSINYEAELGIINERSKDISLCARSDSRYKQGNYKGAIEDIRRAKEIRMLEINNSTEKDNVKIDYKNILLGTFIKINLEPNYNTLIKVSRIEKSRYDLITDYKKVISNRRKEEVIRKLENLSELKYEIGDYKASIKAIRRADKYY